MSTITYAGKEPSVVRTEETAKILSIMESQLKILAQLATTMVFVQEGTRLRIETKKEES